MRLGENLSIAIHSISHNKLRTFLTILGIVVGIFSIIVIMTIVTMLQNSIEEGVSFLSKNTFTVSKYPAVQTGDRAAWDKIRRRKNITVDDFNQLSEMLTDVKCIGAYQGRGGKVVKFGSRQTNPNTYVVGATEGVLQTLNLELGEGRDIRKNDIEYSNNICILGNDVIEKIFYYVQPIGQIIRVDGKPFKVVGTLKKRPEFFGQSQDNYIVLPITTFKSIYGKHAGSCTINVMSTSKENYESTIESTIGYMRKIRRMHAGEDNDFDIASNETVMGQINGITGNVKIGSMVVSAIALIAAGVGIMNIMLVSVTERTREIGIRKALGARKSHILMQFLTEAIMLSLVGGIIGILLGIGIGNFAGSYLNAVAAIPYDWVGIGIALCVLVGVGFGTYPAYKAANLDPIEALRYE